MSFIFTTNSPSTPRKEKVADWAGSKRGMNKYIIKKSEKNGLE